MITRRLLKFLSVYIRITSNIFYAVPIQVDKLGSDFTLRMQQDGKSILLFCLNFSFQCETMIWSFLRLCQMHMIGEYKNMHPYVIHGFNLIGFGYPVLLQLFLTIYGQAFCDYFNQSVAYNQQLRKKYWKRQKQPKMDLLESGVATLIPGVYFQALCFGMYSIMKPSKPFFHCSLLIDLGWPMWAQSIVKLYECYMFINCWHVIVSTWVVFATATFANIRWSSELVQCEHKIKMSTVNGYRSVSNSLTTYPRLYMLCTRFNQLSRVWVAGMALFFGKCVAIYMGYATIKLGLEQTLPITEYMAYPTSCLFLLVLLCFVSPEGEKWHTDSVRYIQQVRMHPRQLVRKTARTLIPMAVWILDFFPVHRGFGVKTVQDVVIQIGDLVISVGT